MKAQFDNVFGIDSNLDGAARNHTHFTARHGVERFQNDGAPAPHDFERYRAQLAHLGNIGEQICIAGQAPTPETLAQI